MGRGPLSSTGAYQPNGRVRLEDQCNSIYRDDLGLSGRVQRCTQHPNNVWALHGLAECLERRGESEELPALQARLATALAKADVPINSSCLCRTSAQSEQSCCYPAKILAASLVSDPCRYGRWERSPG